MAPLNTYEGRQGLGDGVADGATNIWKSEALCWKEQCPIVCKVNVILERALIMAAMAPLNALRGERGAVESGQ
jgi:hypothetical protein